jgi:hypothetical protein
MALIEAHVLAAELIEFGVGLLRDEPQELFGVRTDRCARWSGLYLNELHDAVGRLIGAQSPTLRLVEGCGESGEFLTV